MCNIHNIFVFLTESAAYRALKTLLKISCHGKGCQPCQVSIPTILSALSCFAHQNLWLSPPRRGNKIIGFLIRGTQVPTTDLAASMCSRLQVRDHCPIHWFHTILIHPPPQRITMAVLDCSISVAPSNTSMQRCANWQRTLKWVAFQELNVHWCHYLHVDSTVLVSQRHSEVGQSPQIERIGCLSAAAQLCDLSPCANKPSHPKIQNWTPAKIAWRKVPKVPSTSTAF